MKLTATENIELGMRAAEALRSENAGRSVRWLTSIINYRVGGWPY